MNVGKTLFAQITEFVPWTSFSRIVARHSGNTGVRPMNCAEQFRVLAFAQLTWRESLRDIEVTLGANANKRYAMGLRHTVHRSTLADTNDSRDWRTWSDLAALLIRRARKLYCECDLGLDLTNTVYALDSTMIDLCLSLFEWAPFPSPKAAIKIHTLLDLRGAISAFTHISDGKMGDVNVLDILPVEAGAFYVMDRGYLDFARLYKLHQAGAFRHACQTGDECQTRDSAATDRATGVICDQAIAMNGFYVAKAYPDHLRPIRFKDLESCKTLVFLTNNTALPPLTIAALYKNRWYVSRVVLQIDQAAFAHQEIPRHQRERGADANLVRRAHLRADRHRQEGASTRCLTLHIATDSFRLCI